MNKHVNSISGRLSLRAPQRHSLDILARVTEIVPPRKSADVEEALRIIQSEYPSVHSFERDFPSLCFALATGVGKTRLMGAFVSYLHLAHGINNFFVLAPNLTIYNKLIADFTPNTAKYVLKGIAEFSINPPAIITGDDYQQLAGNLFDQVARCKINIFNISKINSEVRGGKLPKFKRLAEYIGQSYFDYLAGLPDLVLLMDESHRYRATAGVRAINELKPILGLELTATPLVETSKGTTVPFQNVIYDYALARAMAEGFVKEPAVVTRKDFNPAGMSVDDLEKLKLEDGIRLHESTKVELETYARETGNDIVKPFVLVIARDTTHAGQLQELIKSEQFFDGRYRDKVIQVDSSQTGEKEDEMIGRLLRVEDTNELTEIVIHVNMLKEGWDVTNLYTIVPLRAANARILIEQSIGRGLRLPYGRRTGVAVVDRLSIVAHDRFQEIINEANRPDSTIRLQQIVLTDEDIQQKTRTVVSQSNLDQQLGVTPPQSAGNAFVPPATPIFHSSEEIRIAQLAQKVIQGMARDTKALPSIYYVQSAEIQHQVLQEVAASYRPEQLELEGVVQKPDFAAIIAKTSQIMVQQTIDIPRISVVPVGEVTSGFEEFTLDLSGLRPPATDETLWVQYLRTGLSQELGLGAGGIEEQRLENYVVAGLIDFDDVSYDDNADLLYNLASQVVEHLRGYLPEEQLSRTLRYHQRAIAHFVHAQMLEHHWEEAAGYEAVVSSGFSPLKPSAYSALAGQDPLDFRVSPKDKSNMSKYVFAGFTKCLYALQKFDSDAERQLSVILDRDALKWFKPARGQFQIYYRSGTGEQEYQPDFVAEGADYIFMLEPKARNQLQTAEVVAKKAAAIRWCENASAYSKSYGGKPWVYVLLPHDIIAENMSLEGLRKLGV